ncbi:hypothetical protein ES703_107332 [subsurface metagenome]
MNCQPLYACIGAISAPFWLENEARKVAKTGLIIHEGYTDYRYASFPKTVRGSQRGKVTYLSIKSRIRLLKRLASIRDSFQLFQTFTFPDDIMEGKTITERSRISSEVRRRFLRVVRRRWPSFKAVIRQEWQARKSGKIIGQECPHLHFLYLMNFLTKANYKDYARILAGLWVECLHTQEVEQALSVAQHESSYTWMHNQLMGKKYISKYIAKVDQSETKESRGRAWYMVGEFDIPAPEWQALSNQDNIRIRRLLRRYMKGRNHHVARSLRKQESNGFCFIQRETIYRMIGAVSQAEYRNRSPDLIHLDQVRCRNDEAVQVDLAAVA